MKLSNLLLLVVLISLFLFVLSDQETKEQDVEATVDDLIDEEEVDEDDTAVLFGDVFGSSESLEKELKI